MYYFFFSQEQKQPQNYLVN